MVDRVNIRDYPALVADVSRLVILYRHGGVRRLRVAADGDARADVCANVRPQVYQDAALVFRKEYFCLFAALYAAYDGVFVKRVLPDQHKAATNATPALADVCDAVPAPLCAGGGPAYADDAAALDACRQTLLCAGIDGERRVMPCADVATGADDGRSPATVSLGRQVRFLWE